MELDASIVRGVPSLVRNCCCWSWNRRNRFWNQVLLNSESAVRKSVQVAWLHRIHSLGPSRSLRPLGPVYILRNQDFNKGTACKCEDRDEQSPHDPDSPLRNRRYGRLDLVLWLQSPLVNVLRPNGFQPSDCPGYRHCSWNLPVIHLDRWIEVYDVGQPLYVLLVLSFPSCRFLVRSDCRRCVLVLYH